MRHERWRWTRTSCNSLRHVSALLKVTIADFTHISRYVEKKYVCVDVFAVLMDAGLLWVPCVYSGKWQLPLSNYIYTHRSQPKDMKRAAALAYVYFHLVVIYGRSITLIRKKVCGR